MANSAAGYMPTFLTTWLWQPFALRGSVRPSADSERPYFASHIGRQIELFELSQVRAGVMNRRSFSDNSRNFSRYRAFLLRYYSNTPFDDITHKHGTEPSELRFGHRARIIEKIGFDEEVEAGLSEFNRDSRRRYCTLTKWRSTPCQNLA
jgi:hypothetical protein